MDQNEILPDPLSGPDDRSGSPVMDDNAEDAPSLSDYGDIRLNSSRAKSQSPSLEVDNTPNSSRPNSPPPRLDAAEDVEPPRQEAAEEVEPPRQEAAEEVETNSTDPPATMQQTRKSGRPKIISTRLQHYDPHKPASTIREVGSGEQSTTRPAGLPPHISGRSARGASTRNIPMTPSQGASSIDRSNRDSRSSTPQNAPRPRASSAKAATPRNAGKAKVVPERRANTLPRPPKAPMVSVKQQKKKEGSVEKKADGNGEEKKGKLQDVTYLLPVRPSTPDNCFICTNKVEAAKVQKIGENGEENEDENAKPVKKMTSSDNNNIKCAFPKCTQRMHRSCADGYHCSEYTPYQAQLLFLANGPVCPQHVCWHCYEERQKNSSRFGSLVDCEKCFRSFHEECVPAGLNINKNGGTRRASFICHYHSVATKPITKATRLKYCADCEQTIDVKDPTRRECQGCTNLFHEDCGFKTVKGTNLPGKGTTADFCSYCLTGAVIVPNQYVMAYYPHSFAGHPAGTYPGVAMAMKDIPALVVKSLGSELGKLGMIPIKWEWSDSDKPYYNMVHKSRVQRMTLSCMKNLTNKFFKSDMNRAMKKFKSPYKKLDFWAMKGSVNIVKVSQYKKGVDRFVEPKKRGDILPCECKVDNDGVKCRTDCLNKSLHSECLPDCGVECVNRSMQLPSKELPFETRMTEKKGFGAFATEDIKKGSFIAEYAGEIIDVAEKQKREERMETLRSHDEWTYMMGLTNTHLVDARFIGGEARYINHSCDPNSEVNTFDIPMNPNSQTVVKFEPRLKIHATRDIKMGEEITFNYGLGKARGLTRDVCHCGSQNCSGRIGLKKGERLPDEHDTWVDEDAEKMDDEDMQEDEEKVKEGDDEEMDSEEEKENKKNGRRKSVKKVVAKRRRSTVVGVAAKRQRVSNAGRRE